MAFGGQEAGRHATDMRPVGRTAQDSRSVGRLRNLSGDARSHLVAVFVLVLVLVLLVVAFVVASVHWRTDDDATPIIQWPLATHRIAS